MGNWQKETIQKVWEKAAAVPGVDSNLWRKDIAGAWISRKHYDNDYSEYGWEIDHIEPVTSRGKQYTCLDTSNLQPLQWQNKRSKADNYPSFSTSMTADINVNVEKIQYWSYSVQSSNVKRRRKKLIEVPVSSLLQA